METKMRFVRNERSLKRAGSNVRSKYCSYCGARLKDGARFCSACGKKVILIPGEQKTSAEQKPSAGPDKKKLFLAAVSLIAAIICLGTAAAKVPAAAQKYIQQEKDQQDRGKKEINPKKKQSETERDEEPVKAEEIRTEEEDRLLNETETGTFPAGEEKQFSAEDSEDHFFLGGSEVTSENPIGVYIQENAEGECRVTFDVIKQYIPDCTASCFSGCPRLGNDVEDYLKDSFCFSDLIKHGELGEDWGSFWPHKDPDSTYALMVFQAREGVPYLTGYFIGKPESCGNGTWLLSVTPCDYDISGLGMWEEKRYQEGKAELLLNYIPLQAVLAGESNAEYFLAGYNTGRSADMSEDDYQMYHLWSQMNSPYRKRFAFAIEKLESRVQRVHKGRWMGFLLLDEDYELIGYTAAEGDRE